MWVVGFGAGLTREFAGELAREFAGELARLRALLGKGCTGLAVVEGVSSSISGIF